MKKGKPFTRRQRARMLKQRRIEAAAERREMKAEAKAYQRGLDIFKRCDPERTERLADGE